MTTDATVPTLADVVRVLEGLYDPAWARDWDAVGLVCGDPAAPVRKILLAVDPSPSVVEEAIALGAGLLLTHHPLLLRPVNGVAATTSKGRRVHQLIKAGCALYTAHTNADVAVRGVSDALARVLGLTDLVPLSADPGDPIDKIVAFAPTEAAEAIVDALTAAGAGDVGAYRRCAFVGAGEGTFVPGSHGSLASGESGHRETLSQARIEMVFPRHRRTEVVAALLQVHPHEQPAFDVYQMASWSGPRGIGRVGRLAQPTTLRDFAMLVAEALPSTVQGVRVAGDPNATISRVAVCGGAGDKLIDAAAAAGADVYVTSDLRHHPALEAREESGEGTPHLIDVAHWASEWPWLAGVSNRLAGMLEDAGTPVEVHVSGRCTDPWTFRVPSPGGVVR